MIESEGLTSGALATLGAFTTWFSEERGRVYTFAIPMESNVNWVLGAQLCLDGYFLSIRCTWGERLSPTLQRLRGEGERGERERERCTFERRNVRAQGEGCRICRTILQDACPHCGGTAFWLPSKPQFCQSSALRVTHPRELARKLPQDTRRAWSTIWLHVFLQFPFWRFFFWFPQ